MMTKYEIIYADPPWHYGGQKMLSGSKAENHYPTMKLSELKALPVQSITDDNALLFMWSSSPHLDQAIELMKAWGFSYATVAFVWDKVRPVSGFYTMSQCEICLVGKKGKIPQPRGVRNALQSTIVSAYLFWKCYASPEPITIAILSHKLASSKHLLNIHKTFYNGLPNFLKRPLSVLNTTEMRFEDSGAGIIAVSAEGKGGLRSFTCSYLQISEYAFAPNPEELKSNCTISTK
jgi:N6-adenosine-specific RNA methylase IME4